MTGQHDAVVRGGVSFALGMVGSTASFDGSSGYLEVPDAAALDPTTAFTLEAWINPADVVSELVPIITKWDDNRGPLRTYFLSVQRGQVRFSISDNGEYDPGSGHASDLLSSTILKSGIWQHVAAVYDGTHMRIYLDGQLDAERSTVIRSVFTNERPLLIGAGDIGAGEVRRHFTGQIDDPAIYGRALTPSEISAIYEAGSFGKCYEPPNQAPLVNAGGPYAGAEGAPMSFDFSASDPDGDALTYVWDLGDGTTGSGPTPPTGHTYADDGTYTVTLTASDGKGGSDTKSAAAVVTNVAPVVTAIGLPPDPAAVGASIAISASFTDVGTGDTHAASFDLDNGGPPANATVAESNGSGTATAVATYSAAGVYVIRATVTDDDGGSGQRSSALDVPSYVVVYDPSAGFVTGGGWISSPAGAYVPNPSLTGKASFGFVAKYQKGASTPSGNTEFQFKAGSLNFHSTSYDWLVVAGAKAQYKGEGTINGVGGYGFMLTAIDGDVNGGGGGDAFRIKIWDLATGSIVYDNKLGEDDTSDAATSLGGGSIVIHDK